MQQYINSIWLGSKFFGPFVNLTPALQQDALDMLYYFPKLEPAMEKALLACCLNNALSADIICRIIEIAQHHYRKGGLDLDHYVAFLITIQIGIGAKPEKRPREEDERVGVTEKVSKVSDKVCWGIGLLCGKEGMENIMTMIQPIVENTLVCPF